jgi:hypothetical protein
MTTEESPDQTSSSSLFQSGYYMPAGIPTYAPLYLPTPLPDATMGTRYPYGYGPHIPHPMMHQPQPLPQLNDHTEIMSIIPTLRCWSCVKCGNLNYAHRLTCNLRKCQRMTEMSGPTDASTDWMCACGNVNYRFRKYCNLRKCQLPQIGNPFLFCGISQLIKAGYAPQSALSLLLTNSATGGSMECPPSNGLHAPTPAMPQMEGCWQCASCGNLNWPWRDECNRRGCGKLKRDSTTIDDNEEGGEE